MSGRTDRLQTGFIESNQLNSWPSISWD